MVCVEGFIDLACSDVNKTPGLKTKTETPTLKTNKTKTPHHIANIHATFMSNVQKFTLTMSQWHNIPIQVSNFKKIHTLTVTITARLHHETMHATLWVSSAEAQSDQLPLRRKYINSSSIVSPILAGYGFIVSHSRSTGADVAVQAHREQSAEQWSNGWVLMWGKHICLLISVEVFMVDKYLARMTSDLVKQSKTFWESFPL